MVLLTRRVTAALLEHVDCAQEHASLKDSESWVLLTNWDLCDLEHSVLLW